MAVVLRTVLLGKVGARLQPRCVPFLLQVHCVTMVGCAVFGCTNRSEKGICMYGFPRDTDRRKKWLAQVSRSNFTITRDHNNIKLCAVHQVHQRYPQLRSCQAFFCSTPAPSSAVSLKCTHGRLVLEVPLPSRSETCRFFLRPMLMTVGDLMAELQEEDSGAEAFVLSKDGERVASSTLMDALLAQGFQLCINNVVYDVHAPEKGCLSSERARELQDMKHLVHVLHTALHQPDLHLLREKQLLEKVDHLKQELAPLEQAKAQLSHTAESHTSRVLWTGVALLSVQGGALAWLTWWVYSWDVMEPVTYFITYATSMAAFAYYVLTKQDSVYPDAQDRQFLRYFYKAARKKDFSVDKYNELKDELAQVEEDLRRLRNPNWLQLPLQQIQPKP